MKDPFIPDLGWVEDDAKWLGEVDGFCEELRELGVEFWGDEGCGCGGAGGVVERVRSRSCGSGAYVGDLHVATRLVVVDPDLEEEGGFVVFYGL